MHNGIDGAYHWCYPKIGGACVHQLVSDYEALKRSGYSIYEDLRDLEGIPLTVVDTAVDNTITELNSKGEVKNYTCKCGKVFNHHLPYSAHKGKCK